MQKNRQLPAFSRRLRPKTNGNVLLGEHFTRYRLYRAAKNKLLVENAHLFNVDRQDKYKSNVYHFPKTSLTRNHLLINSDQGNEDSWNYRDYNGTANSNQYRTTSTISSTVTVLSSVDKTFQRSRG